MESLYHLDKHALSKCFVVQIFSTLLGKRNNLLQKPIQSILVLVENYAIMKTRTIEKKELLYFFHQQQLI